MILVIETYKFITKCTKLWMYEERTGRLVVKCIVKQYRTVRRVLSKPESSTAILKEVTRIVRRVGGKFHATLMVNVISQLGRT